jgi:hypothetical protein
LRDVRAVDTQIEAAGPAAYVTDAEDVRPAPTDTVCAGGTGANVVHDALTDDAVIA